MKQDLKAATTEQSIIIERILDAPVERVWKAISDKDEMKNWYFDIEKFQPVPGFQFSFYGEKDGVKFHHLCEVIEAIPNKKLSYSWRYDMDPAITLVTVELFKEGDKTRIKLTHEGVENFSQDNPDLKRENFVEGWTHIINQSLPAYIES